MTGNPFEDRSTPIILRARDMRLETYAEQHISAIELLLAGEVRDPGQRTRLAEAHDVLVRDRAAWLEGLNEYDPSDLPAHRWEALADALEWSMDDAVRLIESNTPERWDYTSDPDDPSYGGFYPYNEEDEDQ